MSLFCSLDPPVISASRASEQARVSLRIATIGSLGGRLAADVCRLRTVFWVRGQEAGSSMFVIGPLYKKKVLDFPGSDSSGVFGVVWLNSSGEQQQQQQVLSPPLLSTR